MSHYYICHVVGLWILIGFYKLVKNILKEVHPWLTSIDICGYKTI